MILACPALTHLLSSQILQKVLQGCREGMLGTMALAACQFMEEPGMEVQVRESKHPYNNNTSFEVRLHIRPYLPLLATVTRNTFPKAVSPGQQLSLSPD